MAVQTYVSPDVDRANCRSRGGNNSQGAIYKVQVGPHVNMLTARKLLSLSLRHLLLLCPLAPIRQQDASYSGLHNNSIAALSYIRALYYSQTYMQLQMQLMPVLPYICSWRQSASEYMASCTSFSLSFYPLKCMLSTEALFCLCRIRWVPRVCLHCLQAPSQALGLPSVPAWPPSLECLGQEPTS